MKSFIKIFSVSIGNPIAWIVLIFAQILGSFHKLSGNTSQLSFFGFLVLVILGGIYLVVCALFRMVIKRRGTFLDCIGQVSATMFRLSVIGLIILFLFFSGVEGNVFGFLIVLPVLIFALVWMGASLYAIWKSESGSSSTVIKK